jgi:hypothetical protein
LQQEALAEALASHSEVAVAAAALVLLLVVLAQLGLTQARHQVHRQPRLPIRALAAVEAVATETETEALAAQALRAT